jgi:hypothetical protein
LELAAALDRRSYTDGITDEEKLEQSVARWMYRRLACWFEENYILSVENQWVHPSYIFKRSLIEFAAAVVVYKDLVAGEVPVVPGCSAKALRRKVFAIISDDMEELTPLLEKLVNSSHNFLRWSGPSLVVTQHSGDRTIMVRELDDYPLYLGTGGKSDEKEEENDENQEEDIEIGSGKEDDAEDEDAAGTEDNDSRSVISSLTSLSISIDGDGDYHMDVDEVATPSRVLRRKRDSPTEQSMLFICQCQMPTDFLQTLLITRLFAEG